MTKESIETISLGTLTVPRLFLGLWQSSSPAWGSAPRSRIMKHFQKHVDLGFTTFDMADHYGDAEVTFGRFRTESADSKAINCATKWCVFGSISVTEDSVRNAVSERLTRLQAENVDLLQFHWQEYNDHQYIKALKLLQEDSRVTNVGLCNFDTKRMNEIAESGIEAVSNQVQFSLIDSRPTFAMAESCRKHNIKLLTYGTLCGGFLAEKWVCQPEPASFDEGLTPSHRKYLEMINAWGGWKLFQILLNTLSSIAIKHSVTVSLVATRWVLDHDYVGAVIIGVRIGVSEHAAENLKAYGWSLDEVDRSMIDHVLEKSRRKEMFAAMGDCGSEYRQ